MISVLLSAALVFFLIFLAIKGTRTEKNGEWHTHRFNTMRRMTKEGWEYRQWTPDEAQEDWDARQF
jgi:hypothetical protein